jgi:hypothetical protein
MSRYCGQLWWSTAGFKIRPGSFSQVELGGLEPPTPACKVHTLTGTMPDVDNCPAMCPSRTRTIPDVGYRK